MICAICGRETEEIVEGMCVDCFMSRNSLFELPSVMELVRCPKCGSYLHQGRWEELSEEEALLRAVRGEVSVFNEIEDESVEVGEYERTEGSLKLAVRLSGKLKGIEVSEEKFTDVRIRKAQCERCSRISGGYYEGIIQIRAENREVTEEELERIIESVQLSIESASQRGDRKAFISKIERRRDGTNIYIGSKRLGRRICRKLVEEFGGKFTESPELVGREDGKEKYRVTYSFRLPRFRKGDVIELKGRVFGILSERGGYRCVDLERGDEIQIPEERMEDARYISSSSQAFRAVVSYVSEDVMEIIHPENYSAVTIQKPSFVDGETKEIRVVLFSNRIYPLPEWL